MSKKARKSVAAAGSGGSLETKEIIGIHKDIKRPF
jgi:hypothetical protein